MPIAFTDEQRAMQAAIRAWADRSRPVGLTRRLEPGAGDRAGADETARCWQDLAALGVFSIALPPEAGGAGGTITDLAAATEELSRALVPGPVLPTLLAGLILRGAGAGLAPAVKTLLPALADGQAAVAVTRPARALTGTWQPGGTLRVSGTTGLVLGGADSTHLLLGAATGGGQAWFLADPADPGIILSERPAIDFSRSLATVHLDDVDVPADRVLSGVRAARVRDLTVTLYAAEAAGVAGWACATAAAYARTREQFGRPIGWFQAIKHLCAGMLARAEQASVLAWDAARAADEDRAGEHSAAGGDTAEQLPLAAAAATAALDLAVDNAKDCIQVLGGIGFTWEHDAHLYLRRALALRQLAGGTAPWRARTAQLTLAGARRRLAAPSGTAATTEIANRARRLAARIAARPPEDRRPELAAAGYVAPQWPRPFGLAASPAEQAVIDAELHRAGLTRPDLVIGGWAVPAIIQHGPAEQAERFAGPTLRGEITWCQLFSEPDAGSDLAALRTKAVPVEGGWRLSGRKVWTSLAREADWAICLARTEPIGPATPKQRGLTFFLVEMGHAGIEISPLREITGRAEFNEVVLDDVFVPSDCVVGAPGDGWRIARGALADERVAMGQGSALGAELEELTAAIQAEVQAAGRAGNPAGDPLVLDRLGGLVAEGLAGSLLDLRTTLARLAGREPGPEAAVRKLVGVAHRQSVAELALTRFGPEGAASDGAAARAVDEFLLTRCLSIAGGTTQILLSVVAERALGLPRDRDPEPAGKQGR